VTVVHTGVANWPDYTRRAEIVIAAAGVPGILRPEHVAPGSVIVGGGVRYEGRRLLPDVDEACAEVAGAITPRLGGVGPTTVAMLFRNCVTAAERAAAASPPSPVERFP
jgi:methylenetetrahydrofolate dehydrogenase (NADP+)/methenyltetrahydrofolate cyclohydrolase